MSHFRIFASLIWFFLTCAGMISATQAHAAVVPGPDKTRYFYTSSAGLDAITSQNESVLDWRSPNIDITFDMPGGDHARSLVLKLAATPQNGVSASTPLLISLNGSKPVPVHSEGYQFDAEIVLPQTRLRPRANHLTISYKTPSGADCLLPGHGQWTIDMARSSLVIKARGNARAYHIGEVEPRLSSPFTAPQDIAIIARGEPSLTYEAMAAQGIGLRMGSAPHISLSRRDAPFSIYIGTRADLSALNLKAPKLMSRSGPAMGLSQTRPMQLILTGDTDAQVTALARAFARHRLPVLGVESISLTQLTVQPLLTHAPMRAGETRSLSALGSTEFANVYRPKPARLFFHTEDTRQGPGQITLKLTRNAATASASRVDVNLNGQRLGYAVMDQASKTVGFDIAAGQLRPGRNEIAIAPKLEPVSTGCTAAGASPGVGIDPSSTVRLGAPPAAHSLSAFTAGGSLFVDGEGIQTVVMLPARPGDRAAALRVLAMSAAQSGRVMSRAQYRGANAPLGSAAHIVAILPAGDIPEALRIGAPSAFRTGLKRSTLSLSEGMSPVNIAGMDERAAFAMAANSPQQRIQMGGLAAIYMLDNGQNVLALSAAPGVRFDQVIPMLARPQHWAQLSGSVTRWNSNRVVSVQAGGINVPRAYQTAPTGLAKIKAMELSWPQWSMPQWNWPELKRPDWLRRRQSDAPPATVSEARPDYPPAPSLKPSKTAHVESISVQKALPPTLIRPAKTGSPPAHKSSTSSSQPRFNWDYFTANIRDKARAIRAGDIDFSRSNVGAPFSLDSLAQRLKSGNGLLILLGIILVLTLITALPKSRRG